MTDTVYKERANGRWEFWTYADGQRVLISEAFAQLMLRQGVELIISN